MSRHEVIGPRRPSLWDTIRSYTLGPLSLKDPEIRKYFQSGDTSTGIPVNEYSALNYSAVWSAVNMVSGDVASMPCQLFKRVGKNKELYNTHPLYRILHDAPNPEMHSLTFRQTLQAHVMTWGNGYAEIERDAVGRPKHLWPITPNRVSVHRSAAGELLYHVASNTGPGVVINPADMLHLSGMGWDGCQGYSPIAKARDSIALGIAAERFGSKFFENGSTFGGVITHPSRFATPAARENFEKALKKRGQGVDRAHGLLLMEENMSYQPIGVPPDQAQFLESRQFQVTEIARWFNIPPHKLAELSRATFSNIEQQNREYYQSALFRWVKTWEHELGRKLISQMEMNQQVVEFNTDAFLRGDSEGRAKLYSSLFAIGAITPNEIRARENLNPIEGGDTAYVPLNSVPIDMAKKVVQSQIDANNEPPAPPQRALPPGDSAADQQQIAELRASVERLTGQLAEAREFSEIAQRGAAEAIAGHIAEATGRVEALARAIKADEKAEGLEQELGIARSLLKDAEERLDIATKATEAVTAERDQFNSAAVAADVQAGKFADRIVELGNSVENFRAEHTTALADLSHVKELLDGATTALAAEQAERAREMAEAERVKEMLAAVTRDADEWARKAGEIAAERDATHARNQELAATLAESEEAAGIADEAGSKAVLAQQAADERALLAEAEKVAAVARASDAERDRGIAEAAQAAANSLVEQRRQAETERMTAVIGSHRALFVDAMGRMVRREIANAKNYSATPQRMRAWLASYYDDTERALFVEALLPSVRIHLAWMKSPAVAGDVAASLVDEHFATSQREIGAVLDAGVEGFRETTQKLLRRWESERAPQFADRVMAEEITHVRQS